MEKNGQTIIINPQNQRWLRVTSQSLYYIEKYAGMTLTEARGSISRETGCAEEQVENFLVQLARLGYVLDPEIPPAAPSSHKLWAAYANITNKCNLRCPYCYIEAGEASVVERDTAFWEKAFTKLAEGGVKVVVISGGEPLLRDDLRHLLAKARQTFREVRLLTNGTLLHKEMIPDLLEYVDVINVSIDGAKAETHERFRGNGTFSLIIENIRRLKEEGFQKLNLAPTISRLNLNEVSAIMDLARKLGAGVDFSIFVPAGRGRCNANDLYIQPKEIMKAFLRCYQYLLTWLFSLIR